MSVEKKEKIKDKFKGRIQVEKVRFFNKDSNWGIVLASVTEIDPKYEKPQVDKNGYVILKGSMPEPELGKDYNVTASLIEDPKWGFQYDLKNMSSTIQFDTTNAIGQKKYLLSLFTAGQVNAMYNVLDNPFEDFNKGDFEKLVQVKGIGVKKAIWMVNKFQDNYSLAKMIIELDGYGLTNKMMKKLINNYKSADLAIEKVKDNPYTLVEISGIGFSKADQIALSGGIGEFSCKRIEAFIVYFLTQQAQNGFNYITTDLLMDGIIETIGEEVNDLVIAEAIHGLGDKLWYNEEKTLIGLMKYYILEEKIAKELLRIRDAESNFNIEGWEEVIKKLEIKQGWNFAEQQLVGIGTALKENLVLITGKAGSGKTSIAEAMLKVLDKYSHCTCALSGRAGARIAEITGEEGFTIHRLLGYPGTDKEHSKNGFDFHDENPLKYDIIIVDEVSMIGGHLWFNLLRAIKSGSKLILLGDVAQLESIGECNVASDIIKSPEIPVIELDKIHRQAAKSAIITESLKIREGQQIITKDFVGEEIRGEMKDLLIDCYSDKSNTFYKVLEHFQKEYQDVKNILDIQIICPVKSNGDACTYNINNAIQDLYNPENKKKKQVEVYNYGKVSYLREGDKVINTKNNYNTFNTRSKKCPIYNGNLGILREIDEVEGAYTIDFQNIGTVIVDREQLNSIELGYAITGHKFQGSQASHIIIALDYSAYTLLSREWVYTAITRAQSHCTLIAQNSALRFATSQEKVSEKTSHLVQILNDLAHPKLIF